MVTAGASGLSCEEEDESIFVCEKDGCILLGKSTKMEVTVMVRNVINAEASIPRGTHCLSAPSTPFQTLVREVWVCEL